MDQLINAMQRRMNSGNNQSGGNKTQGGNKKNNNQKKKGGKSTRASGPKKCLYCNKTNHGIIDCYKRKDDKAPCYNAKGEPFYPEEKTGPTQQVSATKMQTPRTPESYASISPEVYRKTIQQDSSEGTGPQEGSDFPSWV